MNKFIYKILREAEDSTDDFFQSKHIEKRKEEFKREFDKKNKEALIKLKTGLREIKAAYNNKDWKNEIEKLFLESFSKLHVDDKSCQYDHRYGYCLLDSNNIRECFYDLKSNYFRIDYDSIWERLNIQLGMSYYDTQSFVNKLLEEHFKLYDVTARVAVLNVARN